MTVKVNKLRSQEKKFIAALTKAHLNLGNEVSKEIEKEGEILLNKTLEHRGTDSGFKGARVKVKREVVSTRFGVNINMHFSVVDGSGKPHWKWHIMNKGRKNFTAKKTHRFRKTKAPRTSRRTLEVREHGGLGEWIVMPKGSTYGATKGREFYKEVRARLKNKPLKRVKYDSLKVKQFEVNNG